jgi:BMFP domain-containing protein YqiC
MSGPGLPEQIVASLRESNAQLRDRIALLEAAIRKISEADDLDARARAVVEAVDLVEGREIK